MTQTTPETATTRPMEAIAEIVRNHAKIIDYTDNQIRFHGVKYHWVVSAECKRRGYQPTDVYKHWHYTDGKRERPVFLMVFNLPESPE